MTENHRPATEQAALWVDHRRWLLLGLVLVIYLVGFNGQWRPGADSAESLLIARGLIEGQPYAHHQGWYIPIGLPYLLWLTALPTGRVNFVLAQGVMLVTALGGLAAAFVLLRAHFGRPAAVLLTGALALTETYYRLAFDLLTDVPFNLGLLLMLLGWTWADHAAWSLQRTTEMNTTPASKRTPVVCGFVLLVIGIAVMTLFRSVVVSVVTGVVLTVLWRLVRGPRRGRAAALGAVSVAAWLGARYLAQLVTARGNSDEQVVVERLFGELPRTLWRMLADNLPRLATENAAEALFAVDLGPIPSVLLLLVLLLTWVRLLRTNALWAMIVAVFFAQWLLFLPGDRYFLPVLLPLLVGWWASATWLETKRPDGLGRGVAIAMLALWVAPNLVFVGRFIAEQRQTPYVEKLDDGRFVQLAKLGERLHEKIEPDALIIGADGPLLSWYSGRNVMDKRQLWAEVERVGRKAMMDRLRSYPKLYVIRSPDAKLPLLRKLDIHLHRWVLRVRRGEGERPWVVHPATIGPLPVQPHQLDEQQQEQPDAEDG